jgi:hypothetical protein
VRSLTNTRFERPHDRSATPAEAASGLETADLDDEDRGPDDRCRRRRTMSRSRWRTWGGVSTLAVALAACGGGEADHEDGRGEESRSLSGPSATTATPTPAPTLAPAASPAPAGGTGAAATVAWDQDIQPILANDCVRCHGYMSSYAGTMSVVTPGNPSSALVTATRSGGSMYSYLSGDRAAKSALIRAWVVDNGAAQSR